MTIRTMALAAGDAAVLVVVHPAWGAVCSGFASPRAWFATDPDVALAAICGVLLWLAAAWVAVGLLAGLGARLPGATGRLCARCVRVAVPRVLLRVVLGSTGLGLLAAPAAHAMTPANGTPVPATGVRVSATSTWVHQAAASSWIGAGIPAPTWPVSPGPAATPTAPSPTRPAPLPPTSGPTRPSPPSTAAPARTATARVRAGDSLWLLAARRLGPHAGAADIAHYWPQIYAANRDVIGTDPSAIHPGQVVHLPTPTTRESS